MADDKGKQLPDQPRGPSYQFKRLYDLGPIKLGAVKSLLVVDGIGPRTVATTIQEEWGDCKDVEHETLAKQLQRYRNKELDPKIGSAVDKAESRVSYRDRIRKFDHNIDVIAELSSIMLIQKARIEKALEREDITPALLGNLNKEIDTYNRLNKTLGDFQLQTGIMRRVPRQVSGHFNIDQSSGEIEFEATVKESEALRAVTKEIIQLLQNPEMEDGEFYEPGEEDDDPDSGD